MKAYKRNALIEILYPFRTCVFGGKKTAVVALNFCLQMGVDI